MKFDNYRIKETTSIHTGRRGGGGKQVGHIPTCGRWKFRRDISGARSPSPTPGPPAQGSNARKISPHNFWMQKNSGDWVSRRHFWSPKQFLLKNPHMDSPTQTHSLWTLVPGWQIEGYQWYAGEGWGVWHQGEQRLLSLFWALPP